MKSIGPLMTDIGGLELAAEDREALKHPLIGGVILFTRNYRDRRQLGALCRELSALRQPRLLLAVDHEGGRVQRFREGFTRVPAMNTLGRRYLENRRQALAEARRWGRCIGRELSACGLDLSFAPVLDRDTGKSEVIGDRAFSSDVTAIAALARAFCRGLAAAGHAATGKHFPGHGAVTADSHQELPVDPRPWKDIAATDLVPFAAMIRDRIPSLMLAHVRYSAVDAAPASLSRFWIRNVLRRRMKYDGALFCDDLSMGGAVVAGPLEERAEQALDAGCDMLPVCNNRTGLLQLLDVLKPRHRPAATRRLKRLYRRNS
ncbi:MAG: beta-N-acetylhexosaminidase [Nevskiales bacterium]|nr:beta-N-acetylhexosaminidase [Nevskiales bacterium]